jgi:hypothetical protein
MPRMVTFEERVWTITAMPRVDSGASTTDEPGVLLPMSGLRFLSNKGDKYFLPLEGRQLPTDEGLHALSLDRVADLLKRAMRERSPTIGGGEAKNRL